MTRKNKNTTCYLTPHFALHEFTRSSVARRYLITNEFLEDFEIRNLTALATKVLEPMRALYNRPLLVTSGYRSAALNARVGGVPDSQHRLGEAADVIMPGVDTDVLAHAVAASDIPFDQLIYEARAVDGTNGGRWTEWIHISHKAVTDNRREVLSIIKKGGRKMIFTGVVAPSATPLVQEEG